MLGEDVISVKGFMREFVGRDVFEREDGEVRFSRAPWTSGLRTLLRGYLKLRPAFAKAVRDQYQMKVRTAEDDHDFFIIGPDATERVLLAFAQHGELTASKVRSKALMAAGRIAWKPF